MRALYCLISACLFLVFSCTPSGDSKVEKLDLNNPDIIWAKRSNFKVDFNDENDVKNLKVLDKDLAAILLEQAEKKELSVYDPYDNTMMSGDEVDNLFHKVDSVLIIDPDTDEEKLTIVRNDLDKEAVKRYRVEQEWYFDKSKGELISRIMSLTPLIEKYGSDGSYRGDAPLFKIKLN